MNIVEKRLSELIPYKNNPKIHTDEQIAQIARSIELTKGLRQPIVIDANNVIVAGHGRFLAAKKLGLETVPCEMVDDLTEDEIRAYRLIDNRIAGLVRVTYVEQPQDPHLSDNQKDGFACGDNGIFKGAPVTAEQRRLCTVAKDIYNVYRTDGKYILDGEKLVICQSNAPTAHLQKIYPTANVNPLGEWTGGLNVDTGATNRKLGSDMGDSVTGGGLHGKDLSKADVSINIYLWIKAQHSKTVQEGSCAIGDKTFDGKSYREIVDVASRWIHFLGGFEKFAEWGLIR